MKNYVCGFLFDPKHDFVVLIRKQQPEWQKGRLNGLGGKIEDNESPIAAMVREFQEESGLFISAQDWIPFCEIEGQSWRVYFFFAEAHESFIRKSKSMTSESVDVYPVGSLFTQSKIPNLHWLIPMCIDPYHQYATVQATN
jgi:8-oxo-dGTP diphosphatase